jgi:hypothetical protein
VKRLIFVTWWGRDNEYTANGNVPNLLIQRGEAVIVLHRR